MNTPTKSTPIRVGFLVRKLVEEDIPAVLALEQSLATAPHWKQQDYETCLSAEMGVEKGQLSRRLALVLESDGFLAGFVIAAMVAGEAELESICVAQENQRQGAGARLLSALLLELKASRVLRIFLEVRASNAAAIALYGRFGFVEVGRRPRYYSSPEEDAIHMLCEL